MSTPTSLLALASAFTLDAPTNPIAGEVTEIHWSFTATDPAEFDLFLMNSTEAFGLIAVLGTVLATDMREIHTLLPATIPAGNDYQLRAVDHTNVDRVYAFSPVFTITAAV
ncbi:hypothetical protein B0H14DRAFT_2571629 [Mycena olivaceomarginata]|nr:hypothetical protein B0H14DRAFT_2649106 [Mycena olivaceomarginata]KAJ7869958.1 hypothetical protein B0H14DRAFT_2571629 [Mycena olivaceomarginata]